MARKLAIRLPPDPETDKRCREKCDWDVDGDGSVSGTGTGTCPNHCDHQPAFPSPPPPRLSSEIPTHQDGHMKIPVFLTAVLGVLVPTFFFLACYAAYRLYSSCRRPSSSRREDDGPDEFLDAEQGPVVVDHPIWYIRTVGLDPSAIGAITAVRYRKGEGIIDGTDCPVCLNEFQEEETLRLLPKCSHAFHAGCIDTWLRSHTNCPLCRAGIVSGGSVQETLIEESGAEVGDGMMMMMSGSLEETMSRSASAGGFPWPCGSDDDKNEVSSGVEITEGTSSMKRSVSAN